jgi:hypothetical protein
VQSLPAPQWAEKRVLVCSGPKSDACALLVHLQNMLRSCYPGVACWGFWTIAYKATLPQSSFALSNRQTKWCSGVVEIDGARQIGLIGLTGDAGAFRCWKSLQLFLNGKPWNVGTWVGHRALEQ